MRKLLIGAALAALAFVQPAAAADSYNVTLAGASPGGLWSLLGSGVDAAVKTAYPGSTVTYQTSGGGFANIGLIDEGKVEMGIAHDAELLLAKNGKPPFKSEIDSMRGLAYLYTWAPMHVIVRKDFAEEHGVTSFSDIADKKIPAVIAINKRGNVASNVAEAMLDAIGADAKTLESWGGRLVYAASGEQANLMQDRRIDIIINSLFVKHSSILEIANAIPVTLLGLSEATIEKVNAASGSTPYVIEAGSYDFAADDVPTVTLGAALVVSEEMSDEDAYNLTKALFEHDDKLAGVHNAMKQLTPEVMASLSVIPYHDGALKYLKEAGLR
ncbi:MAG: TAXI family TRAP transporter solute-binding subunit [Kiloniellales bacterium]